MLEVLERFITKHTPDKEAKDRTTTLKARCEGLQAQLNALEGDERGVNGTAWKCDAASRQKAGEKIRGQLKVAQQELRQAELEANNELDRLDTSFLGMKHENRKPRFAVFGVREEKCTVGHSKVVEQDEVNRGLTKFCVAVSALIACAGIAYLVLTMLGEFAGGWVASAGVTGGVLGGLSLLLFGTGLVDRLGKGYWQGELKGFTMTAAAVSIAFAAACTLAIMATNGVVASAVAGMVNGVVFSAIGVWWVYVNLKPTYMLTDSLANKLFLEQFKLSRNAGFTTFLQGIVPLEVKQKLAEHRGRYEHAVIIAETQPEDWSKPEPVLLQRDPLLVLVNIVDSKPVCHILASFNTTTGEDYIQKEFGS